jgi:carboxypeptidase Q
MFRKPLTASIIVLLLFSFMVPAQPPTQPPVTAQAGGEKVDLEMMKKIRAEGLDRSKVMDTLSWLTDVHGPRLTGSPQLKAANEFTMKRLTEWGLENAHLEAWGPFGKGWTLERFSAQVIEPNPFPLIAFPKAWTPGTNGSVSGEAMMVTIQSEADFDKYRGNLKNAFVMINPMREVKAHFKAQGARLTEEDLWKMASDEAEGGRQYSPEILARARAERAFAPKRTAFLKSEGVAGILDSGRAGDGGTLFVQQGGSAMRPDEVPSVVVAIEHYGRITRMLEKGIKVKLEMNTQVKYHEQDNMAYNTIAEIPGTDKKDEIVMLGAHLDSWHGSTGATDNAAGCSVVMEAVRILKTLGVQPRRTIRVALWTGEEQGLYGSSAYVAKHFGERKPLPPAAGQEDLPSFMRQRGPLETKAEHSKLAGYFNLDNGTGKIRGVYLQGNEAVRPIFRAWLAPFRDLGAATLTINNTSGTDHLSFDGVGLPGFQFIQDEIEYDTRTHHTNMDSYERIQPDDMKQASVIMAAFIYNAAMRDEKLPRKALPGTVQQAAVPTMNNNGATAGAGRSNK